METFNYSNPTGGSPTTASFSIPAGTSLNLNNASLNVVTQAGATPTTLTNNGTLNGNVTATGASVLTNNGALNGNVSATDTSSVTNKGTLNGNVSATGTSTVTNDATIDGSVYVGSGSQLTNNAGATITGPAYGGGTVTNYGVIDPKVEPITADLVVTRQVRRQQPAGANSGHPGPRAHRLLRRALL